MIYPVDSVIHPLNNQDKEYGWLPVNLLGKFTNCKEMIFDKLDVDIPQVILRRPAQSVTVWVLHIMYCVMEDI